MIHYQIDLTENEYSTIQGNAENIMELKNMLFSDGVFKECVAYIDTDAAPKASMCIASVKECGVFLGIKKGSVISLSLNDRNGLKECVDVWGDGLYVSRGLFIPPEAAWKAICEFAADGSLYQGMKWIDADEVPEEGNYII